jgi:hypothetical protein
VDGSSTKMTLAPSRVVALVTPAGMPPPEAGAYSVLVPG